MSLSAQTVTSLGRALRVLLSPLDHPRPAAWLAASLAELRPLLAADATSGLLAGDDGPEFHRGDVDSAAVDAYARHYHRCDDGFGVRRRHLGLEVWTTDAVWERGRLHASEYWNDYKVPHRLYDALGVSVEDGTGTTPTLFFYRAHPTRQFGERETALAAAVHPAFRAALRTIAVAGASAARLAEVLDALAGGVCVFDLNGRVLHQNSAATRLFAGSVAGERLRQESTRAAHAAAGLTRRQNGQVPCEGAAREFETGGRRYRVAATCVHRHDFGSQPVVVVCVERAGREVPPPALLAARFGLTKRETDVTHLLMQGRSNADIAAALGVSEHTARHHTERVMVKLGVHSRAQVGPALLGHAALAD
jgi:DNA-binding CsgD family transcriptional regulator